MKRVNFYFKTLNVIVQERNIEFGLVGPPFIVQFNLLQVRDGLTLEE